MTTQTEITKKVKEIQGLKASKTSATQMIKQLFEYKSYKELIDKAILEVYGETTTSTVDWEARVKTIRANQDLTKKELIELLVQDEGGHKASLTQMMGYVEMCKEWARQEALEEEEVSMEELEEVIETINKA